MAGIDLSALSKIDPRIWQSIINVGGGILEGAGQNANSSENRQFTAGQNALDREQQQKLAIANYLTGRQTSDQNLALTREAADRSDAQAGLDASGGPLGISDVLQKARTKRQLFGSAQNISITPPADIAPFMGHVEGGMRIPDGGLDVSALSEPALAENLRSYLTTVAQRNPKGTTPNLEALSLGAPGAAATQSIETARQGYAATDQARRDSSDAASKEREAQIMQTLMAPSQVPTTTQSATQPDPKQHTSFWHKIGTALKVAAPIATSFIPGIGPVAGALLNAGINGGVDALQHQSIKNILTDAGGGALSGALATKSPFKIPRKGAIPTGSFYDPY
jgi:hypothetical protein